MKQIIVLLICVVFTAYACTSTAKVSYEFPNEMAEPVKLEFAKACDKGRILYEINCAGCHNNNLASGGYNFATYNGLAVVANNGKLVGAVSHASGFVPMPQGGKLTDCQIAQITKWVQIGALNN